MQAVLISSKNFEEGREEAQKIFKELKIDKFDISLFEYEKAVGIGNIRELQKKIYLKPFKSKIKAVLVDATAGITQEAQNALLKTLEETPSDTIVILQVANSDEILPTILSRCKVIEIKNFEQNPSISQYLNILISSNVGDKLKLAQNLSKDKEETLRALEDLIITIRKKMIEQTRLNDLNHLGKNTSSISQYLNILVSLQRIHTIIKTTNVNLRLALENLFLNT